MAEGKKEKIDQVLEEVRSLKEGQQKNCDLIQKNYGLIQKNGVSLEQLGSDIKAVAEGHDTIRSEMRQMKSELFEKIEENSSAIKWVAKELGRKIEETKQELKGEIRGVGDKLDAHMRQSAHA